MTIQNVLTGEKVKVLHVNIVEKISQGKYIVADLTGMAIMKIEDETHQKQAELGKAIRVMKPKKVSQHIIACNTKLSPMKTKAIKMNVVDGKLKELQNLGKEMSEINPGLSFDDIKCNYGETAVIPEILTYVTSLSKVIDGKYGPYQISNLRDCNGSAVSINLYKGSIDGVEVNKVYRLNKIRKTTIKDESGLRLGTTNFTKIQKATDDETKLFENTKIADHKIEGDCLMINEFHYYKSCMKHSAKLDEENCCTMCGQIDEKCSRKDFRCNLIIEGDHKNQDKKITESDDDIEEEEDEEEDEKKDHEVCVMIFKRHVDIEINSDDDEDTVQEKLEDHVIGKKLKVQYNEIGVDNNIAVKVDIIL